MSEVDTQNGDVVVLGFAGFIIAAILTDYDFNIEVLSALFTIILSVSIIKNIIEKV